MSKPTVIAFYLPQFHPFKENDEWWGKGFTEWTNVGNAKPLFKGHYQPRVPADLGYYDLRVPEVRIEQAELARKAGITAFCYWHYWFAGKQLMNDVFDSVLASGEPDFPFCLGWANHSWYAKTWDKNSPNKLLIEQTYPGEKDMKDHFDYLLRAFKDNRYLKIDGKPLLFIFDTADVPEIYLKKFRKWTVDAGFPDLYVVGYLLHTSDDRRSIYEKGVDALVFNRYWDVDGRMLKSMGIWGSRIFHVKGLFLTNVMRRPAHVLDFNKSLNYLITNEEKEPRVIPQILTGFDHSPRSGRRGYIFNNYKPESLYRMTKMALDAIREKDDDEKIIFVKSWNEWAEGNYLEPDLKYGHKYIEALRKAIDEG